MRVERDTGGKEINSGMGIKRTSIALHFLELDIRSGANTRTQNCVQAFYIAYSSYTYYILGHLLSALV